MAARQVGRLGKPRCPLESWDAGNGRERTCLVLFVFSFLLIFVNLLAFLIFITPMNLFSVTYQNDFYGLDELESFGGRRTSF